MLAVPSPDGSSLTDTAVVTPDRISYDYRLVVSRQLYDRAVGTAYSPSLAPLATPCTAHMNPLDLDALGVAEGQEVRIVGSRGAVVVAVTPDEHVARGSVRLPFNVPGTSAAEIVDLTSPVTDVRVERM